MPKIDVERLGGFAGFGGPGSRLRSRGSVESSHLAASDQASVDALFAKPPAKRAPAPDAFTYRLTRHTKNGPQTVHVSEQEVPEAVRSVVKDELV